MNYVYACTDPNHPRKDVKHGMHENPGIRCEQCGSAMYRVPQAVRFYHNPGQLLLDKLDEGYRAMRKRRSKK